jgi:hypothetical protein
LKTTTSSADSKWKTDALARVRNAVGVIVELHMPGIVSFQTLTEVPTYKRAATAAGTFIVVESCLLKRPCTECVV